MNKKRSIGKQGVFGFRQPISVWRVFIPTDEDRDVYVANCIRTSTVSLINDNNEFIHKVPIGKLAIQHLVFPQDQNSLGSPVVCGNVAYHNQLIVLDVLNFDDDYEDVDENEASVIRRTNDSVSEVRVQGNGGKIYLNVDSDLENGGELYINVTNSSESAKLNVTVNGDIKVDNTGNTIVNSSGSITAKVFEGNEDLRSTTVLINQDQLSVEFNDGNEEEPLVTNLKYEPTVGLSYLDEFENQILINENEININGKNAVKLGQGTEPIVLGDALAQLLKDILNEISISQTSAGPLLNAAKIAAFVSQVDNILSQYSTTD